MFTTNTNRSTLAETTARSRSGKRAIAALAAFALLLAACGSDDDSAAEDAAAPAAAEADSSTDSGAADVSISTGSTDLGDVLVDGDGLSLYGFTPDEATGAPTCGGACADAWPPILVPSAELPAGLDSSIFGVVDGIEDGTHQLTAGGWPLYLFAGDAAAGDINGQGSGDSWFLVAPDGSLITDEAAAPAQTEVVEESNTSGGYDY